VISGAEPAAILKLIKELDAWRRQAISAAKDKNATRAAHWLYAGTLAVAASEQLRVDFTAMLDEIDELDACEQHLGMGRGEDARGHTDRHGRC
jgi:hypothetical protein